MSQIDQAFIKAYRSQQQAASQEAAPAPPSTLQRGTLGGSELRVDAPHVACDPPAPSVAGQRVPTPHLQLTPDVASRLEGIAGRKPNEQARTDAAPSPRWSSKFRTRNKYQPAPEDGPPTATDGTTLTAPAPAPTDNRYTSVEETLMRLVGVGETAPEAEAIQVVSGRIQREVEVAKASQTAAPEPLATVQPTERESPELVVPTTEAASKTAAATESPVAPAEQPTEDGTAKPTPPAPSEEPVAEAAGPAETDEHSEAPPAEASAAPVVESQPDPEVEAETALAEVFQPAWEVDCFHWPDVVGQLQTDPIAGIEAACNSLRETVGTAGRMLAITGVNDGVGATTVSLLLARGLAKLGLNVALVDADFEQPSLAEHLGVRIQDGWEAAIEGRLPLEEVCVASLSDGVTLVPLGQDADVSATKASLSAAGVLEQLTKVFDFVLIDAGTGSENVAAVATSSDEVLDVAVLLAVDERKYDSALTGEIIAHLKQFSIESVQIAQTFVAV